jgi:hypothetical protein
MRVLLSLALAFVVAVGMASAQEAKKKEGGRKPAQTKEDMFKAKDKDGDGKLTLEEMKADCKDAKRIEAIEKEFKAKDKDGDGALTLEEFKASPAKKAPPKKEGVKKAPAAK